MNDENVKIVCNQICNLFSPERLIIFSQKTSNGKVKSFKVCAVIESENVINTEHDIYLTVESEIPFDIIVYSPKEWERLLKNKNSFAAQIETTGIEYHV